MLKSLVYLSCLLTLFLDCTPKKQSIAEVKSVVKVPKTVEDAQAIKEFDELISEYESEDRDTWQQPEIILSFLGDLKGKTVADIGAGTGYFSFKLAKTAETVYAVEIDKRFLDYIEERKEGLMYGLGENVITLLTSPDDPGNYPEKIDLFLLVNTYSYINHRPKYFKKVKDRLKRGGFLCIVDFKEKNIPVGPPSNIKVGVGLALSELKKAGFKDFKVDSVSLPYQYILKAS